MKEHLHRIILNPQIAFFIHFCENSEIIPTNAIKQI